jgi:hypothetical protein
MCGRSRRWDLREGHALDPVRAVRGQRVADNVSGVVADDREPLVAERVHKGDQVAGESPGVVSAAGLSVNPIPRWSTAMT